MDYIVLRGATAKRLREEARKTQPKLRGISARAADPRHEP